MLLWVTVPEPHCSSTTDLGSNNCSLLSILLLLPLMHRVSHILLAGERILCPTTAGLNAEPKLQVTKKKQVPRGICVLKSRGVGCGVVCTVLFLSRNLILSFMFIQFATLQNYECNCSSTYDFVILIITVALFTALLTVILANLEKA